VAEPADLADPYAAAGLAAQRLAELTGVPRHDVVVVLGSGWAGAADCLGTAVTELAVADLPGFHPPVAEGHPGRVRSTVLDDGLGAVRRVLTFLGRTHLYEGHGPASVVHAIRTAARAGCRLAVLTNANGSLRPAWTTGTMVLLRDHLDLSGASPLVGPRFVDLTDAYSPRWRSAALAVEPGLVEGVYAMLRGPHYQTRAETLMLRTMGADVVGMSTVLETIAAREAGLDVLGLSVVTTVEATGEPIDPQEVVRVAAAAATRTGRVIAAVLTRPTAPTLEEESDVQSDV
jgi:purine-nucleoside phosphorylase